MDGLRPDAGSHRGVAGSRRQRRHRHAAQLAGVAVVALLLAGCAAGANPSSGTGDAGFWLGLWQGLILPVTFVISLFRDDVTIYEVANSGNWYDAGFVLGAVCSLSGGGAASRSRG